MKDLVIINSKKEAVCSHVVISEGMGVTQESTQQLIKKYRENLGRFGKVSSEMRPLMSGQNQKEYMLNRNQAYFLITLMRNNPKTVAFKERLIYQFSEMESWIKERITSSVEYKVMCSITKEHRELQGKETKAHHYMNEAKLVNFALNGKYEGMDRSNLSENDLKLLNELQARNAVLIGAGMDRNRRRESLLLFAELNRSQALL